MKIIIALAIAASLTACSSAKKQPETAQKQAAPTPTAAKTAEIQKKDADVVKTEVCEAGKDKRTLEVRKKDKGCELEYTKFGKQKSVSSSKHSTKHCEDSLDKIIKKLESQKYTCNPA